MAVGQFGFKYQGNNFSAFKVRHSLSLTPQEPAKPWGVWNCRTGVGHVQLGAVPEQDECRAGNVLVVEVFSEFCSTSFQ